MNLRDIFEFNDPEKQEELLRVYGPTIQDWDDVENWDDVVIKEQKALVSDLEGEYLGKETCPNLKRLDNYFYFCGKRCKILEKMGHSIEDKPTFDSAQYNSHVDHLIMQLYCLCSKERYQKCINLKIQNI